MIIYKSEEDINRIRKSARLVSQTLAEIARHLKPGITTREIDSLVETYIREHGAIPSFKNYQGYPASCCVSVNDRVVHGIPDGYELQEGDIVSVDCGVLLDGFHGDSAYTFAIGQVEEEVLALMAATKTALYKGIEQAVAGNRIGDIAFAIQQYTERERGYGVVRELVGHGLGRELHEDPQVPNYGKRGTGILLREGLVIAIEPMINLGTRKIRYLEDGWTVVTQDHKPSAHYEHTLVVRQKKAEILSDFRIVEEAEQSNPYLNTSYYRWVGVHEPVEH
ncbi:type I methionyl aminopeptidase [Thermoflavifilum thermophilum]|uniref:Methionine aminopeptidase n=1 Tax=Thermoflavifilum thermophilum TaxID=1393122 RepID=A0A1I7N314_9BACT|nr:type I methionyl aminopeptidase [Thermoflavifilum thermophilum]SFV29047.1 methionyl aminopeptidase [Thermoflavifilum thermophilum]